MACRKWKQYSSAILKVSIYVTLFLAFVIFYLYDQITQFIKGSTTFTTTFIKTENLPLPVLLVCIPGVKQSAIDKYGYSTALEIIYDENEEYKTANKTPLEMVMEQSLILGQDVDISISFFLGTSYHLNLGLSEDQKLETKQVFSTSGICYLIETKYPIQHFTESTWFSLTLKAKNATFAEILSEQSLHNNIQIFITSNDTWQGFYLYSWQYFDVPNVMIPIDTGIQSFVEINPRMINFRNGVDDVKKCINDLIGKINCSHLCYPVAYNQIGDLPDCKSYQDMMCMINNGYFNPYFDVNFGLCLRPANAMVFKSKVIITRPSKKFSDEIFLWFKYSTDQLEINEEVPILGVTTLIGSVGGSLGLFLGFSCYEYLTNFINRIANALQ